jgi:hypothetical protein
LSMRNSAFCIVGAFVYLVKIRQGRAQKVSKI